MNELQALQREYYSFLDSRNFVEAELDYAVLEGHKRFLDQLDVIGNSSISIFDLNRKEHVYLSSRFESTLRMEREKALAEGNNYFDRRMHPADLLDSMKTGLRMMQLCYEFPVEERTDYKLINEYRMEKGNGEIVRVIEQFQGLELDNYGNVWLGLGLIDISPNQDLSAPFSSRLVNFKTGELFYFPTEHAEKKPSLSKREKEVLNLISRGKISKEIADQLYISVHTVNTHRQRIIEKLDASNTFEAIRYAGKLGLLD